MIMVSKPSTGHSKTSRAQIWEGGQEDLLLQRLLLVVHVCGKCFGGRGAKGRAVVETDRQLDIRSLVVGPRSLFHRRVLRVLERVFLIFVIPWLEASLLQSRRRGVINPDTTGGATMASGG